MNFGILPVCILAHCQYAFWHTARIHSRHNVFFLDRSFFLDTIFFSRHNFFSSMHFGTLCELVKLCDCQYAYWHTLRSGKAVLCAKVHNMSSGNCQNSYYAYWQCQNAYKYKYVKTHTDIVPECILACVSMRFG